MANIDNRAVQMTFNNATFERRLAATLGSLDALNERLATIGAFNGLQSVEASAKQMDLSGVASGVENISSKFTALGAIGFSVIQNLTNSVLAFAKSIGGVVLEPILGGGKQRALNLEQATFLFEGLGMDVEAGMKSALDAVRGTAFGLDAAAKAAAQLGGSGLQAGAEMTGALRGIAGIAAMTNSSYEEMADIFITAAGNGKVMSNELGRISHRGVNAAAALAKEWGVTETEVREMATNGEISFQMFAEGMDAAFGEHATKANETYAGSLANLRAALARVGASFYGPNLENMRNLFNGLMPVVDELNDALQPLIRTFTGFIQIGVEKLLGKLQVMNFKPFSGAMQNISAALKNVFKFLGRIGGIAKRAFRDIFPERTGSLLTKFAVGLKQFTDTLNFSGKTANYVRNIFRGIFSVFAIGIEIIKNVVEAFRSLFSSLVDSAGGGGRVLKFFSDLGRRVTEFKRQLVDEGGIAQFFEGLIELVQKPIAAFNSLREALVGIFTGESDNRATSRLEMLGQTADRIRERLSGVTDVLDDLWTYIKEWFGDLGNRIAKAMSPGDFNAAVDVVNVGLITGLALLLRNFLAGGVDFRLTTGIIERVRLALVNVSRQLQAMQMDLRASALLKIGAAIALIAASVLVLSMIDSKALTKALTAMTVGFGQLVGSFLVLSKVALGPAGAAKITALSISLIALAFAALLLASAVKKLSAVDPDDLAKGLGAMVVILGSMAATAKLLQGSTVGLIRAGIGIIFIAIAMNLLAGAMKIFATMSWEEIAKGLAGVAGGLTAIVAAMNLLPNGMAKKAAGIFIIAAGLNLLATAMKIIASMSWGEIAKGLVGISVGLLAIAIAMQLMPKTLLITAAGLFIVGLALNAMAMALTSFAGMSWEEIGKGLATLAGALIILAVGAHAMSGALLGAFAIGIMSVSLVALAGALKTFGMLSVREIVVGLIALAASLAVLGAAAFGASFIIGPLFALGAALILIGAGFALFGAGAALTAKAFETIAKLGGKAIQGLGAVLKALVKAIPDFVNAFVTFIVELAKKLTEGIPVIIDLVKVIVIKLLDTIIELTPKIVDTVITVVLGLVEALRETLPQILETIRELFPDLVDTGFALLMSLLEGIRDNIEEIVTVAMEIITEFLTGIADNIGDVMSAGTDIIVELIAGLAASYVDIIEAGKDALLAFMQGIADNMIAVIDGAFNIVITFINELAEVIRQRRGELADAGLNLLDAIFGGVTGFFTDTVAPWLRGFPALVVSTIGNVFTTLLQVGKDLLQGLYNGARIVFVTVRGWFRDLPGRLLTALGDLADLLWDIGWDIIDGLWQGMKDAWNNVSGWLGSVGGWIVDKKGPPKKDAKLLVGNGMLIMNGLQRGMEHGWEPAENWLSTRADVISKAFMVDEKEMTAPLTSAVAKMAQIMNNLDGIDHSPVIRPVLDLTNIEAGARKINKLMAAETSYSQASAIASTRVNPDEEATAAAAREVKFEQNIYAPKELSTADIYRQTRSQITLAKEELSIR